MSASRDFLVEIGTEELPPKALRALRQRFADGIAKCLRRCGLAHAAVARSPRRAASRCACRSLPQQPDRRAETPRAAGARGLRCRGTPTRAAIGFAQGCGVEVALLARPRRKGECLAFRGMKSGPARSRLLPGIVQAALDALPIAKRMRWGAGEAEFVRPVHWLVMLFGSEIVAAHCSAVAPAT